jgi:signal transduction histidine kinase
MQSLTRRTMFIVLAAELLCAFVFSRTALWHEERTRLHAFDVMLWGRSDSVLGAVQDAEDANADVTIDPRELKLPPDDIFAVYNYGDRMLGSSSTAPAELVDRKANGYSDREFNRHHYRIVQRDGMRVIDREKNGRNGLLRPITIVYAARTDGMWHDIHEAANYYMIVGGVLLVVTAALLMLLLRQALRPLDELAEQAKAVSKDSLVFEAPKSALRIRELAPLAETLSLTIASLRKAFENEARFVGDAAHELKTAVAVVRSTVQLMMMRAQTPEEITQGLERLLADNQRVEELVARMLTLARMEARREPVTFPLSTTAAG